MDKSVKSCQTKTSRCGLLIGMTLVMTTAVKAESPSVRFSNLKQGQTVSNPVEICMQATGVVIEAVSNGVRPGHGHLHILVDYPLPTNLNQPLSFNVPENVIHLGDGSHCRTLTLSPGKHTLRALVADGSHTPSDPPITAAIDIIVK